MNGVCTHTVVHFDMDFHAKRRIVVPNINVNTIIFPKTVLGWILVPVQCEAAGPEGTACRPSELPLYTERPRAEYNKSGEDSAPSGPVEEFVSSARTGISSFFQHFTDFAATTKSSLSYYEHEINSVTSYLREEDNVAPRVGAITVGGLTGFVFGMRRGFFRRLTYASVGALSMAAVCYPNEAADYSRLVINDAKKYATIAYNFALGVKRDESQSVEPPQMPAALAEVWSRAADLGRSAQSLLTGGGGSTDTDEKDKK